MHISFVIPTRNRTDELAHTLGLLADLSLDDLAGPSEIVLIDNGSANPIDPPSALPNAVDISMIHLDENMGAGARNIGAQHCKGDWIIMLDDDSNICPGRIGEYLAGLDPQIAGVGGEIFLPDGSREAGGLPEVVVGCGCALRKDAFIDVRGYDAGFGYYAEEYDLCAKLIGAGHRILHTRSLHFEHRKSSSGRDFNEIIYRLVRNNGWVIARYAPTAHRKSALDEMLKRYQLIAIHENAMPGFKRGRAELEETIDSQPSRQLSQTDWDRFIGKAAIEQTLANTLNEHALSQVSIVGPPRGKGLEHIRSTIEECGCTIDGHTDDLGKVQVVGSLSPGPMLDAKDNYPGAICPWTIERSTSCSDRTISIS